MTTITADGAAVTYAPAEEIAAWGGSPGPRQYYTTYTPGSPNGGLLVYVHTGGFINLDPLATINDTTNPERKFVIDLYNAGWVIVTPGLTGNNPIGGTQGMHSPYGGSRFVAFTGQSWWERDFWFLLQHLRERIDAGAIDAAANMVGVHGVSASFIASANIALGPIENFWAIGSDQLLFTPTINFLLGRGAVSWLPAFKGDEWPALGGHYEASPGTPPTSPYSLGQIPFATLVEGSPIGRLVKRVHAHGGVPPPPCPMYLYAIEPPSVPAIGTFDADGYPTLVDKIRVDPISNLHDYWHSWILKRKVDTLVGNWSQYSKLATLPGYSYAAPNNDQAFLWTGDSSPEFHADLVAWVNRRMTNAANPEWTGSEPQFGAQAATSSGRSGRLVQHVGPVAGA